MQQSFTAPDMQFLHALRIVTQNNLKRRMNHFPEECLFKFGDDLAYVSMINKLFDPLKDLNYQPFTEIGHALPRISGLDLHEIAQCRRCETDNNNPRH